MLLYATETGYQLVAPLPTMSIPTTLQDSLMARLDRLGTAKRVAQLGATLGRQFSYALLQAVAPWDDAVLQHDLKRLTEAELVFRHGLPSEATYTFKHALVQDTAYQSLVRDTRQQYHQRIAEVLSDQFPSLVETQPELLAHHFMGADQVESSITWWHRAGQRAIEGSANAEAIRHLTQGLDLLATLPVTPERMHQELILHMTLAPALLALKGYSAAEVQQTYNRALELCQQLPETPDYFPILFGLCAHYNTQADYLSARKIGEQLLHLGQKAQDTVMLTRAHHALGIALHNLGDLNAARSHYEAGLALYDLEKHRPFTVQSGLDVGVGCWLFLGGLKWLQGYPVQADHDMGEAIALAERLGHPFSQGRTYALSLCLYQYRQEPQRILQLTRAVMGFLNEQRFPLWIAIADILQGWAHATEGQADIGLIEIKQGLEMLRRIGLNQGLTFYLSVLADAYRMNGQVEEGLAMLSEALDVSEKTMDPLYKPELHRLQGELLLLAEASSVDVEAQFQQALDSARAYQLKLYELRAALSLARLWVRQGRPEPAHRLVSEVYGWFTEGWETSDLKAAQAFLRPTAGG